LTAYTERSFANSELAQFVDAILARQRELRNEGIDERETNRVLVAEFSSGQNYVDDWAPTNNDPTYPALTDGQATTLYPPVVKCPGLLTMTALITKTPTRVTRAGAMCII